MSMIGYYLRADEDTVRKVREGDGFGLLFGNESNEKLICIDKAWHAIHYIVTGCVWDIPDDNPLGQLVLGGEPVNDEDMGYGPARLIPKETVQVLAKALEEWDEAFFREKFDMEALTSNEIYPVVNGEDEAVFFDYIWENFAVLKEFVQTTAGENENMIAFLG